MEARRIFLNTKSSSDAFYNPLCKVLNIRYPFIQAGIRGFTTLELVAAVSNAGGLGILGAARMTSEQIKFNNFSMINSDVNSRFHQKQKTLSCLHLNS